MQNDNMTEKNDQKFASGRWSKQQHDRFMLGVMHYGKDWKKVQELVQTRTGSQVRSHAQKFFNKVQKEQQHKKNNNNSEEREIEMSESQNQFAKNMQLEESMNTPVEIVSLIKNQCQKNEKVNLNSLKKSLESQIDLQNIEQKQEQQDVSLFDLKKQNSYKSMNNILSAYEDVNENVCEKQYQDASYLIRLTKKYKKYFIQGGQFQHLIDFGKSNVIASKVQHSMRKKSFTLVQDIQGDEQGILQEIKKQINADQKQDVIQQRPIQQNIENTTKKEANINNKQQKNIVQLEQTQKNNKLQQAKQIQVDKFQQVNKFQQQKFNHKKLNISE